MEQMLRVRVILLKQNLSRRVRHMNCGSRPGIGRNHDSPVGIRHPDGRHALAPSGKITLRFRGREMAHQQIGMEVLNRVKDDLQELAVS